MVTDELNAIFSGNRAYRVRGFTECLDAGVGWVLSLRQAIHDAIYNGWPPACQYGKLRDLGAKGASLAGMAEVIGVDHLSISVGDFKKSKEFYGRLLKFLGFELLDEYEDSIGWTNGKTRLWISSADSKGRKHRYRFGNVGFHHYAFRLTSRKDVDDLQKFLTRIHAKIVDPAGEYYENYYGVYFEDPDGLELEGMWYGKVARRAA